MKLFPRIAHLMPKTREGASQSVGSIAALLLLISCAGVGVVAGSTDASAPGPRVVGAAVGLSNPLVLVEWNSSSEPGAIENANVVNGSGEVSGWIGPDTRAIIIRGAKSDTVFSFMTTARPDVAQFFEDDRYLFSGFSLTFTTDSIECIWLVSESGAALKFSDSSGGCVE